MTKSKTKKANARKRIVGKGDYDFVEESSGRPPAKSKTKSNPIPALESRVSRLESRVPAKSTSAVGQAAGGLGRLAGNFLGQGDLGEQAGSAIAKWFGHGDYNLTSNSLVSATLGGQSAQQAKFAKSGRGTRITEREYIGDVFSGTLSGSATVFSNTPYVLNPGNPTTFPWLSSVANQFEQYEPHGIIFEFISTSSAYNGTSQALGTVIAATDYDPTDTPYISKIEMESSDYANSSKASDSLQHGIECDPKERGDRLLYVRCGAPATGESLKFYDMGTFQLATQGMSTAGVNLGELWVSYDFTFYKKQLIGGYLGNLSYVYNQRSTTGITTSALFGTNPVKAGNFLPTFTGTSFSMPASMPIGRYFLMWFIVGTGLAQMSVNAGTNCSMADVTQWSGVASGQGPFMATSGTTMTHYQPFSITGPGCTVTWAGGGITTATSSYIIIGQLPYNHLSPIA